MPEPIPSTLTPELRQSLEAQLKIHADEKGKPFKIFPTDAYAARDAAQRLGVELPKVFADVIAQHELDYDKKAGGQAYPRGPWERDDEVLSET